MASVGRPGQGSAALPAGMTYRNTSINGAFGETENIPRVGPFLTAEFGPTSSLPALPSAPAAATKQRSCVVCRARKVRCDKQSPCSNCRRAGIPCVLPSVNRTPRWAKNYTAATGERSAQAVESSATQVMERLRYLENLVKELRSQPQQLPAVADPSVSVSAADSNQEGDDQDGAESPAVGTGNIQSQFGRLVLNDPGRSRYVTSEFWSRVNEELDQIKVETEGLAGGFDSSDEEEMLGASAETNELDRTPSERHSFLFGHNLNSPGPDLASLYPLPSQVPFLLDIYAENINFVFKTVHMPTIRRMIRPERSGETVQLTPANEALMFSIYYGAITCMEGDDVERNFGATKAELNLKYRLGLEHALAKANFLYVPNIVVVQALLIFLYLVRRHDSTRFVWMMMGLAIRMAQGLGLQRDGSHFKHLSPLEVETRRRVWYGLCALDVRSSHDQGIDFTIPHGSFDTEPPKNINDDDIDVNTKETPQERKGITDSTICIMALGIYNISRQMVVPGVSVEDQRRFIQEGYQSLHERYLGIVTESGDPVYRECVLMARLLGAKLMLLSHMPVLFSSPSEQFTEKLRDELFMLALTMIELHHSINADSAFRRWRWILKTYTQWQSILYLLLDTCRRAWSPLVERSWIALHSPWLIPVRVKMNSAEATWAPVRRLIVKARKHRYAEIKRLRNDRAAARHLEAMDRKIPVPPILREHYSEAVASASREKWRRLVGLSDEHTPISFDGSESLGLDPAAYFMPYTGEPYLGSHNAMGGVYSQPVYSAVGGHDIPSLVTGQELLDEATILSTSQGTMLLGQVDNGVANSGFSQPAIDWSGIYAQDNGQGSWLWADADQNAGVFANANLDLLNTNYATSTHFDANTNFDANPNFDMNANFTTTGGLEMNGNFELDTEMDWHSWVRAAVDIEKQEETFNTY